VTTDAPPVQIADPTSNRAVGAARRLALLAARRLWFIALILGAWVLVTQAGWVPAFRLPGPADVWSSIADGFSDGVWFDAMLNTMRLLVQGWAIGVAAAVVVGVVTGEIGWLEDGIRPVVAGLQSVPTIAFLPLAIIWFGFGETAILAITIFGTFKPMLITTYSAVHQISPTLLQAGRTLGARGMFFQRTLLLPAIVPALVLGLKLSWSFAWRALMAAEIIVSGSAGLGGVLELGRQIYAIDVVIGVIVLIMVIGIVFEQVVFGRLERWVNRRWGLVGAT
jgi:NitT/TauT family transport system permease protein